LNLLLGKQYLHIQNILSAQLQINYATTSIQMDPEIQDLQENKGVHWLILRDRLNIRNLLRRKNNRMEDNNYNCVMCNLNTLEITHRLSFSFFFLEYTEELCIFVL
jgi:hypothetical protein